MLELLDLNLILGVGALGKAERVRSGGTGHEENFHFLLKGGVITGSPNKAGPACSA